MEKVQEPKHLKVLRILGILFLVVGIVLIVLGAVVFRENFGFEPDPSFSQINGSNSQPDTIPNFKILIPGVMLVFVSISLLVMGFMPKIQSLAIKHARYVQDQNKDALSEMASAQADIGSEAITKVSKSVKEGFADHKYCMHCGAEIKADSKFCPYCGKEQ